MSVNAVKSSIEPAIDAARPVRAREEDSASSANVRLVEKLANTRCAGTLNQVREGDGGGSFMNLLHGSGGWR